MTQILSKLDFSDQPVRFMHIDLNSCFATVEQQANPLLRHRPIAVAAYDSPRGVIIAPSVEAKKLGIRVGFRVAEAKKVCPDIKILEPDTEKYRFVHHALKQLLTDYTSRLEPKSVDEFVLDFAGTPSSRNNLLTVGRQIKARIKEEIGDYITVSVGLSTNEFLAKTASNLKKPDGLEEINRHNFSAVYKHLQLMDLTGIANRTLMRLNGYGIHTVWDLYSASADQLTHVFHSVVGNYWYLRLRGYQIENYKDTRKSFGQQYALAKPVKSLSELTPILTKLVEKMGFRLRNRGYKTRGVGLFLLYKDDTSWHKSQQTGKVLSDSRDIYREILRLFFTSPQKEIKMVGVSCFNLALSGRTQLELFSDAEKREFLTKMLDKINDRWGKFVVSPASMAGTKDVVIDRIGFGNV